MKERARANITWLLDDLATGGDTSFIPSIAAQQMIDLLDQGVGVVIDMRQEMNDHEMWESLNKSLDPIDRIKYIWLPTDDRSGHTIPEDLFDAAIKIDREYRKMQRKVFVHCHMGINRGPSVAYAILLDRGYGITEAFDMIRTARPQAGIYYAYDALRAHHSRRVREGKLGFDREEEHNLLRQHIGDTMTDEDWGAIAHVIRDHHQRDADEQNSISFG